MTKKLIISFLFMLLGLGILWGCSNNEATQNNNEQKQESEKDDKWPEKPIRMIVAYGAGGGTDQNARLIQPHLQEELGTSVVVENMPGAGTQVGSTAVFDQEADGNTILVTNYPDLNMTIAQGAKYQPGDLIPIAVELVDPRILLVNKDSEYNNLNEFIDAAKADPGSVSVSVTQGGAQDLLAQWLNSEVGGDLRIVGYPSGGEASTAMINGHVDATVGDDYARFNLREDTKALAIASDEKSTRWPEAETFEKQLEKYGVTMPSADFLARYQVYMVKKEFKENYPERYKKLQEAFLTASKSSDYLSKIDEMGMNDLMIWEKGEEYLDFFNGSVDDIKKVMDSLK